METKALKNTETIDGAPCFVTGRAVLQIKLYVRPLLKGDSQIGIGTIAQELF